MACDGANRSGRRVCARVLSWRDQRSTISPSTCSFRIGMLG